MDVFLPTIDAPSCRGGIARMVDAIVRTFPDAVHCEVWSSLPSLGAMVKTCFAARRSYKALWTHHVLPIGTAAWIARAIGGLPYVVFLHGMDFDLARRNAWKRWLTWRVLCGARHIVANSHALANEVRAFCGRTPLVMYPSVSDVLVCAADSDPKPHRREAKNGVRLLTVGRLVERKGHLKVLEAMQALPQVSYDIVGDGPMYGTIMARSAELGLDERVRVHRYVDDAQLADVYRAADIFVMPATKSATDREGFGIVYLEAQLFGLPVIAVRSPGVDEAVKDGETGMLIDDSIVALRTALQHLCADRTIRAALGQRGRERVRAEFTRERQCTKLQALL